MGKSDKHDFVRQIIRVNDLPMIFVSPSHAGQEEPEEKKVAEEMQEAPASFFAHHIGDLLVHEKHQAETAPSGDLGKELEESMVIVHEKLRKKQEALGIGIDSQKREELKHERFVAQRNAEQEALFSDLVRTHQTFETGLGEQDLWSLHGTLTRVAVHESTFSTDDPLHEHIETNFLSFLRKKALIQAWAKLSSIMAAQQIAFPSGLSVKDAKDALLNGNITEQNFRQAGEAFIMLSARNLAELVLGNVPSWVYSYPDRKSYLWQRTVLDGVAAGMAANFLVKYLVFWEKHTTEIIAGIKQTFLDKIRALRKSGEAAKELSEVFKVSRELDRLNNEEIPHYIWKYVSQKIEEAP